MGPGPLEESAHEITLASEEHGSYRQGGCYLNPEWGDGLGANPAAINTSKSHFARP